jgi:hypothetical protein
MPQLEPTELIRADIVDFEAEEIDLGDAPEDDLALDGEEGQLGNEKDVDMDALDTDDEAEDQALGIDTEESDGGLRFLHCNSHLSPNSSPNAYCPIIFITTDRKADEGV